MTDRHRPRHIEIAQWVVVMRVAEKYGIPARDLLRSGRVSPLHVSRSELAHEMVLALGGYKAVSLILHYNRAGLKRRVARFCQDYKIEPPQFRRGRKRGWNVGK